MSDAAAPVPDAMARPAYAWAGLAAAGQAIPLTLVASLPGLVFLAGYDNLAYGLGILAGCVLAGQLIAPQIARTGSASLADALHQRFGTTAALLAAAVIFLVVLPLLAAEFAIIGTLAEAWLGVPYLAAVLAMLGLSIVAAIFLSEREFGRLAATAYVILAAALLVPLVLMALKAHGMVVPHWAYGRALPAIAALEEKLLENGLVDFETFGAHVTPFLRVSQLNAVAIIVSLALGTAVLPHLVTALSSGRNAAGARLTGAWTALFVMLVLVSVPALAAYAKLEIYGAIADATKLAALPAWLEAPSKADLVHIHGTSLALLEHVANAGSAALADPTALADHLAAYSIAMEQRWLALDTETRDAILVTASMLASEPQTAWQAYITQTLPAAAAAAGNDAAILTQASLVIEPAGLLLALPGLTGAPHVVAALLAAGTLAVGFVMTTALVRSVKALGAIGRRDEPTKVSRWRCVGIALGTGALAAIVAAFRSTEFVVIAVSSLSLGAAALFPVAALGLAWKRATAAGAVAAIVIGAAVTLYYDVGIQVFPATFYKTWSALSDAGEAAIEEFNAREEAWHDADGEEAKAAAATALDDWARGTPSRSGLANWAGVDSAAGGVFGMPLGLLALVLVSLVTRRRADAQP